MNKDRDILIHINSMQKDSEGNKDNMEFYAQGKLFYKASNIYITYNESELTGMNGTKTTLKIASDTVTLYRFGSVNTKMIFKENVETYNKYDTDVGILDICIKTEKIKIDINTSSKSSVSLKYQLSFDPSSWYCNELYLDF